MGIKENLFFGDFVEASCYAPLLNEPYFIPRVDQVGLYRGLETIVFPGTVFCPLEKVGHFYRVCTDEYQVEGPLFIDERFLKPATRQRREILMPSKEVILRSLISRIGTPYLWGGNVAEGIFQAEGPFASPFEKRIHELCGLDCSGLLYEATGGAVPRNTSDLWSFGEEVSNVKPLDIFVLRGHVWIMLDEDRVIESKHDLGGVVVHSLKRRLSWVDEPFTIRRFL